MKKLTLVILLLLAGCAKAPPLPPPATNYPDGVYRGTYYDYSTEQLAVEFEMKDQYFSDIRIIGMRYRDGDYLGEGATQAQQAVARQYEAAAAYLLQKTTASLTDLYKKPELIPDVDAVAGATLKTSAVVSAIYDGLSRLPYHFGEAKRPLPDIPLCDGLYHGFSYTQGIERVAVSFVMEKGQLFSLEIHSLKDEQGNDYPPDSREYLLTSDCLFRLAGKPLSALLTLEAELVQTPKDTEIVARLRGALFGGLSRGPYQSADPHAQLFFGNLTAADGTYRGHYYGSGVEQLSIQFEVEAGRIHNIALRGRQDSQSDRLEIARYQDACLLLEGRPVTEAAQLYALSSDSFEAGKLTYAIADALVRGLYKLADAPLLPPLPGGEDALRTGSYAQQGLFIEVELRLQGGAIRSATLLSLHTDAPTGEEEQLSERLTQLEGRPLKEINKLYHWEHRLAIPLISALWDAAS